MEQQIDEKKKQKIKLNRMQWTIIIGLLVMVGVLVYALDNLGVERENYDQVVMVGDRNNDIYGAKENGIQVIGVLYGYGDLAELQSAGADYIAKMPEEIAQIIGRCNHERV